MGQAVSAVAHTFGDFCCEQKTSDHGVLHIDTVAQVQGSQPVMNNMGDVFSITLTRSGLEMPLGLDLGFFPTREAIPVRAVTGFLAKEWNRAHLDAQVLPGDRIVEVNGMHGRADQMVRMLRENENVQITFVRIHKAKGLNDGEYVRRHRGRLEFEASTPAAVCGLFPHQGDQGGGGGLGDAVTGQAPSTATVIPWGGQLAGISGLHSRPPACGRLAEDPSES